MSYDLPLILVNEEDIPVGTGEKLAVHRQGLLHRAFSIFLFNSRGELLLQQRSLEKYHSPGLWTNTCCGHATPSETIEESAARRLMEEMGMKADLFKSFVLHYVATFDNMLVENEIDHVFVGMTDNVPAPDPAEAHAYRYATLETVKAEIAAHPEQFTAWFRIIVTEHIDEILPTVVHEGH